MNQKTKTIRARKVLLSACGAALLAGAGGLNQARATTRYWVVTNGQWSNTANWGATSGGAGGAGVPAIGDTVIVDREASINFNVDYASPGLASLTLAAPANALIGIAQFGTGTKTIAGTLSVSDNSNKYIAFGGVMNVNGDDAIGGLRIGVTGWGIVEVLNNSVLNCAGNATVGLNAAKLGQMTVCTSAVVNVGTPSAGRTLFVGRNADSHGSLTVGGEGSFAGGTVNVWGNMQVGSGGFATLQQLTGSNVRVRTAGASSGRLFIGTSTGAFGSVYVDAGMLTVDESIFVGGDGSGAGGVGALSIGDDVSANDATAVVNTPGLTAWTASGDTASGVNLYQGGTLNIGARGLALGRLGVYGGTLTVLDQAPPAGADPMLNRSIVGGYLQDGDLYVDGGEINTPKIKLGVTAGKTGYFTQIAGTTNVTTLGVGNDGTTTGGSGIGYADIVGGTLNVTNLLIGSTAGGTGDVWIEPGFGTLHVTTLSIAAASVLDLSDNDLVVNNGNFGVIFNQVIAGFDDYVGIYSSTSDGSQILALFDNALVGASYWTGVPIGANAIVGKYTYFGDANLDGQVTGDDYTIIDSNLDTTPATGLGWLSGDMNLDGLVTGDDYTVIDSNLGSGTGNPLAPSQWTNPVPEPTAVALVAIGLLSTRRRRCNE